MTHITRFVANREIKKKLKTVEYPAGAERMYQAFIDNLNIGLFQAEHDEWHQVMNQLVIATKEAKDLLRGDSQEEQLPEKLWAFVDSDVDEKLTRYIARTVDRMLAKM